MLPLASMAVQITGVTPNENCVGALLVMVTGLTSLTPGVGRTTCEAKHWLASALVVKFAGRSSRGGVVSRTVMLKLR